MSSRYETTSSNVFFLSERSGGKRFPRVFHAIRFALRPFESLVQCVLYFLIVRYLFFEVHGPHAVGARVSTTSLFFWFNRFFDVLSQIILAGQTQPLAVSVPVSPVTDVLVHPNIE